MSTIQIQKELDISNSGKLNQVSTNNELNFFKNINDLSSRKITAEDLMGLSWILFENNLGDE